MNQQTYFPQNNGQHQPHPAAKYPLNQHSSQNDISLVDVGPLIPGSIVFINEKQVLIERFLSRGGFAYVYTGFFNNSRICVKRVGCADRSSYDAMVNEATIHKRLSNHPNIVDLIDFSHGKNPNGPGFQLLLLMEFCSGGHLVDFLNARINTRLQEGEVLNIFLQIVRAVAEMHSQKPPIIHRDLKIENVLLANGGVFKVSDFGSATCKVVQPNTELDLKEIRAMEEELDSNF
jgi:serine/threonine protein kinase